MASPGRWVWGLVLGALLGGASVLVDAGTRVADQGFATPRRALALLVLAAANLAVAAPGAVDQLRRSDRGPARIVVATGFVAFDWFVVAIWWRCRRGPVLAVPAAAIAASALVSVVLLAMSARFAARRQVRVRNVGRAKGTDAVDDGRAGATAPSVSLVLPAWNEAEGLDHWLEEAVVALESLVGSGLVGRFEVVVVDDGSTDATAEVVERAGERWPGIRLVSHEQNRGVGAGLRTALQAVTGEFVVSTDADMPVDLAEIGPAIRLIQSGEAELVAGSRIERREDGMVSWMCTAGYDIVVSIAFGVRVDDVNFAFKVARTDLLRSLDLRSEGAFIDAELMASAVLAGHNVHVARMSYRPREYGRSSTLTLRTLGGLGREFVQHAPRIRRLRRLRRRGGSAQRNG